MLVNDPATGLHLDCDACVESSTGWCEERRGVLTIRPWTVKAAQRWNAEHHRKLPRVHGGLWAVRVERDGRLVGGAIVGNPARVWQDEDVLCVLRVAVLEREPNACSALYGACSRATRAMGASDLVTYTLLIEHGTSLRAAGWVDGGLTTGGSWDRGDRPRQEPLFPEPKRRWFAPWGARAKRCERERLEGLEC